MLLATHGHTMGVSTDAILVYGIQLGELCEWYEGAEFDAEEVIAEAYGWDPKSGTGGSWAYLRENMLTIKVEFEAHCYHEDPMYTLMIKESVKRAWRGSPLDLGAIEHLDENYGGEWDDVLKDACKRLGIEYVEPSWWLQSYWG